MLALSSVALLLIGAGLTAGASAPAATPAVAAEPLSIGPEHQLFLDDYLIEKADKITRRVCPVQKHPANPLIMKGTEGEPLGLTGFHFSSVIYDAEEQRYKAWCSGENGVFYFTSSDGLRWERPRLDRFAAYDGHPSNRVALWGHEGVREATPPERQHLLRELDRGWQYCWALCGVFKDPRDPDPQRRYKMGFCWIDRHYRRAGEEKESKFVAFGAAFSPDGIRWKVLNEPVTAATVDTAPFMFDDRTGRWVLFGRTYHQDAAKGERYREDANYPYNAGRAINRAESSDFLTWTPLPGEPILTSDAVDGPMEETYHMSSFRYQGLYIGLLGMFHNYPPPRGVTLDYQLAVSRDNVHFQRLSDRHPFIPVGGVGAWDRFVLMHAISDPIVVGDEIRFYYCGRNLPHSSRFRSPDTAGKAPALPPGKGAIGLGTIQRDRFVAMEATFEPGTLRTRPLRYRGKQLHVNAGVRFGTLTVALLDAGGAVRETVTVEARDGLDLVVPLTHLEGLEGQPVRLEFTLTNGQLYSFWID